jgi:hypothetical protein
MSWISYARDGRFLLSIIGFFCPTKDGSASVGFEHYPQSRVVVEELLEKLQ